MQVLRNYATGDLVGKYRLERVLGEGGMGTVWLARNETLEAPVALKLIRPELHSREASTRLLNEARAAAKIEHPAIVRVFDFGETEHADPFIVMELLSGRSLCDTLAEQTRIATSVAGQILLPVIEGLSHAHQCGVVHRDLKPSNIFLAREGRRLQPKVVDFGIAKVGCVGEPPKLTRDGTILGSPWYMAPEQARGLEDVDLRADVWTICVVLYEAVTGCAAFHGTNYNAVLRSVIEDDVIPICTLGVNDKALWTILQRGLLRDRDERYPSMSALGRDLSRWLVERGVTEDVCGESLQKTWLACTDDEDDDDPLHVPAVGEISSPPPSTPLPLLNVKTPPGQQPAPPRAPTIPLEKRPRTDLRARRPRRPPAGRGHLHVVVAALAGVTFFSSTFALVRNVHHAKVSLAPTISSSVRTEPPQPRTAKLPEETPVSMDAPRTVEREVIARAARPQPRREGVIRKAPARRTSKKVRIERPPPATSDLGLIDPPPMMKDPY